MKIANAHSRLVVVLDEMERQPHVYGESDCLMRAGWAAAAQIAEPKRAAVLAMIGKYQGRYRSMQEAADLLAADGLTPLSLVASFFDEIDVVKAEDGDIGALRQTREPGSSDSGSGDWGFGIFDRGHIHVATEAGTGILPRRLAEKAFRVG